MINKQLEAGIIDWGVSGVVNNKNIPKEILSRPLQYNIPFSLGIHKNVSPPLYHFCHHYSQYLQYFPWCLPVHYQHQAWVFHQ